MRILMYDYEYPPVGGGGGVSHHVLAAELALRHQVVVVTSAFRDLPRREVVEGVEVHRVPVLGRTDRTVASLPSLLTFPAAAWAHAVRALRGRRFDVVNSHFAVPTGPASLPVARRMGIPHVQTIHGGDVFDPSKRLSPHRLPLVRGTVARVLRSSAAVVAQSTDTRDKAM
ncbi:MAG TPA: glycosyltransferase family 4 protein, partial [Longimicrobiales bacterium]|nr:glycosyltransferase family 4 protein [Longimicrobiales bacterium]